MGCCGSCDAGRPCEGLRIGGTQIAFPGRAFSVRAKSANRPRIGAVGASFWDTLINSPELKADTFVRSFEAGQKSVRNEATDLSRMLDVRYPSSELPEYHTPNREPLAAVAESVRPGDFALPSVSIVPGGGGYASAGGGSKLLVGVAVLGVGFILLRKLRAQKAA